MRNKNRYNGAIQLSREGIGAYLRCLCSVVVSRTQRQQFLQCHQLSPSLLSLIQVLGHYGFSSRGAAPRSVVYFSVLPFAFGWQPRVNNSRGASNGNNDTSLARASIPSEINGVSVGGAREKRQISRHEEIISRHGTPERSNKFSRPTSFQVERRARRTRTCEIPCK